MYPDVGQCAAPPTLIETDVDVKLRTHSHPVIPVESPGLFLLLLDSAVLLGKFLAFCS